MEIELREMDMGYRLVKRRPTLAEFLVSDARYFVSDGGEITVASEDQFTTGAMPLYSPIDAGQWVLIVDGIQWGYVIKKNDHVSLIRRIDEETKSKLLSAIAEQVDGKTHVSMPMDISKLQEDDDEDDDEEE